MADAIHIATYYVGNILIEAGALAPSASNSTYRPSANSRGPRSSHDRSSSYDRPRGSSTYSSSSLPAAVDPAMPQQTQQIYIPNDLVGCIIGKGGSKINEIRTLSQSQIKIMEQGSVPPGGASSSQSGGERLVTITGGQRNVAMAVQLLYQVREVCLSRSLFDNSCIHSAFGNRKATFAGKDDVIRSPTSPLTLRAFISTTVVIFSSRRSSIHFYKLTM